MGRPLSSNEGRATTSPPSPAAEAAVALQQDDARAAPCRSDSGSRPGRPAAQTTTSASQRIGMSRRVRDDGRTAHQRSLAGRGDGGFGMVRGRTLRNRRLNHEEPEAPEAARRTATVVLVLLCAFLVLFVVQPSHDTVGNSRRFCRYSLIVCTRVAWLQVSGLTERGSRV